MRKKLGIISLGLLALFVTQCAVVYALQSDWAKTQVEQQWQSTRVVKTANLGATRSLQILPLFEETSSRSDLEAEHGVSYLVKTDQQTILFDVGATPARFTHNAQALGVLASDFDALFISHIHPDHVGGLSAWWTATLQPGDPPLDLQGKRAYIPAAMHIAGAESVVTAQPQRLADGLATLGALSFPEVEILSLKKALNIEQVLAVNVEGKGIVLIMGCGHPGVERIAERAQALFDEPVIGLVGGLHYEGLTSEQTQPHLSFVASLKPQLVAVSPHDSSPAALQAFHDMFPVAYRDLAVGRSINFGR